MRKFITGILIFMAGWGLSRVSYHYSGNDLLPFTPSIIPVSLKADDPEQSAVGFTSVSPDLANNISSLLQRNAFAAVIESYELLQAQSGDMAAADTRRQILSHAGQLIAASRFSLAEQLLQAFLVVAYRDVGARILLAEAYIGEKDFHAAIDQFYEVRGYAYRPIMLQRINSRIRSMVTELAASLNNNNDQNALLALYQHLTQLEPEYAPWFIGLAAAQLALDDREAAGRSLLLVSQDPDVGAQAQAMLAELTNAAPDTKSPNFLTELDGIALHRSGNHFIVDARSTHNRSIRLLIDTGASLTILTPDALEKSGIDYQNTGKTGVFNTANGPVQAPVYKLDSLSVGDWQVSQLEIGVLDMSPGSDIDGLLGMNFLSHFQFYIDQNEALLHLSVNLAR